MSELLPVEVVFTSVGPELYVYGVLVNSWLGTEYNEHALAKKDQIERALNILNEWIPVSERLPEMSDARPASTAYKTREKVRILACTDKGVVFETIYNGLGFAMHPMQQRGEEVIGWMPMPDAMTPPKGSNG